MMSGSTSTILLAAGYALGTDLTIIGPLQRIIIAPLVYLLVAVLLGWRLSKLVPQYPRTPLEYAQDLVERRIIVEWGQAIHWVRETAAAAEECSEQITELDKSQKQDGVVPTLTQLTLTALHNKVCDLSRAIADLCQRGHAEAAFMLWRSIFEIEVNMKYIAQDTSGVMAERFADWGTAAYLRLNVPYSGELVELLSKYPKQDLSSEIGWTDQSKPLGMRRRARAVGYVGKRMGSRMPMLDLYLESNSYIHNDSVAIANDLGSRPALRKGPSVSGHDMPLCLASRSLAVATRTLVAAQRKDRNEVLKKAQNLVQSRSNLVSLEVSMVPANLLSRFGGVDMMTEWSMDDGTPGTPRDAASGTTVLARRTIAQAPSRLRRERDASLARSECPRYLGAAESQRRAHLPTAGSARDSRPPSISEFCSCPTDNKFDIYACICILSDHEAQTR